MRMWLHLEPAASPAPPIRRRPPHPSSHGTVERPSSYHIPTECRDHERGVSPFGYGTNLRQRLHLALIISDLQHDDTNKGRTVVGFGRGNAMMSTAL